MGSKVFADPDGRPVHQGLALRQYLVDRDGNPVWTTDGRPVHFFLDKQGNPMLDADGRRMLGAGEIPPGSHVEARPGRA